MISSVLDPRISKTDKPKNLKNYFKILDVTKTELEKILHGLLTIKLMSTATESVFYVGRNLATRVSSRLSIQSLETFIFMKH